MAGAYCKFCGRRCFVYRDLPPDSPRAPWGGHLATCQTGAAYDREKTGYDYRTAINPHLPWERQQLRNAALLAAERESLPASASEGSSLRHQEVWDLVRDELIRYDAVSSSYVLTADGEVVRARLTTEEVTLATADFEP